MKTTTTKTKELAPIKKQVTHATNIANSINVIDDASYSIASIELNKLKEVAKLAKGEKDKMMRPLNEAITVERERWRPLEADLVKAEGIIKGKMKVYIDNKEAEAQKEQTKLIQKFNKGQISEKTLATRMVNIATPPSNNSRKVKKLYIIDESKLPREYMVPDETKIREALLSGTTVPGAELREETSIVAR